MSSVSGSRTRTHQKLSTIRSIVSTAPTARVDIPCFTAGDLLSLSDVYCLNGANSPRAGFYGMGLLSVGTLLFNIQVFRKKTSFTFGIF